MPDESDLVALHAGDDIGRNFARRLPSCLDRCAEALGKAVVIRGGKYLVRVTPTRTVPLEELTAAEANQILDRQRGAA